MMRTFTLLATAVAATLAKMQPIENGDMKTFIGLQNILGENSNHFHAKVIHLKQVEQNLEDGLQKLIWMEKNNVEGGIDTVNEALDLVQESADYVSDAAKSAADVQRVEEVLDFVKAEANILQKYAGDKLTESLIAMTGSAKQMYEAVQTVKKMAFIVREKAKSIKQWFISFEHLDRREVGELHRETWKRVIKNWQETLSETKVKVGLVRDELQQACADVLDMRSVLEGLGATAELNQQKAEEKMQKELDAAEDAVANAASCNWFTAIFTLGIHCIITKQTEMRAKALRDRIRVDKKELTETLTPLIAKINTIADIGTILYAAGTRKLEAINDFYGAIDAAEMYFSNGGTMFSTIARRKHQVKLDTLIDACDIMLTEAEKDMKIFTVFLTGGKQFQDNQHNIDPEVYTKAIEKEMDDWKNNVMAQKQIMMNLAQSGSAQLNDQSTMLI